MLISATLITHCLYWVIIVAITFVMPRVGAVGTSLERRNHYRPHLIRGYFSDVNMLTVIILGPGIAWKRVAWLNIRNRRTIHKDWRSSLSERPSSTPLSYVDWK